MRKLLYPSVAVFFFASCQIEDKDAPLPVDGFIKYFGRLADQEAKDMEPIWNTDSTDVEGYVVFGTQQLEDQSKDYYVMIADASGNLVADTAFGFNMAIPNLDANDDGQIDDEDAVFGDETAGHISILPEGMPARYAVVGVTTISVPVHDIVDFSFISFAFLNENLGLVGSVNYIINPNDASQASGNQFTLDLVGHDILPLKDGTFLIVGAIESDTDFDFYYRKFSIDSLYWERTLGFTGGGLDDVFVRAYENDNQNIALFGYSNDTGMNGEGGVNVTYIEVNSNGNVVKANSHGITDVNANLIFDDVLADVIEKPGGYVAVGASIVNEQTYAFFMDIDNYGIVNNKDTIGSLFRLNPAALSTQLQTIALGVTATATNDFVIVGQYPAFRVADENRGGEAMFTRVNQVGERVPSFESNYGVGGGNDSAQDVITLPDGKIVVAATIDFGGGVKMISLIKLNDTGKLDR